MSDDTANGLTGVFRRLLDSDPAAAGDPADLGTAYGMEMCLAPEVKAPPAAARPRAFAWLRGRQTSKTRSGS